MSEDLQIHDIGQSKSPFHVEEFILKLTSFAYDEERGYHLAKIVECIKARMWD